MIRETTRLLRSTEWVCQNFTNVYRVDEARENFWLVNLKSEARCSKLLPESHSAYLTSLPSHYTTRVHNNQVQQALLVYRFVLLRKCSPFKTFFFRQHARGPALDKYEVELRNKCAEDWKEWRSLLLHVVKYSLTCYLWSRRFWGSREHHKRMDVNFVRFGRLQTDIVSISGIDSLANLVTDQ